MNALSWLALSLALTGSCDRITDLLSRDDAKKDAPPAQTDRGGRDEPKAAAPASTGATAAAAAGTVKQPTPSTGLDGRPSPAARPVSSGQRVTSAQVPGPAESTAVDSRDNRGNSAPAAQKKEDKKDEPQLTGGGRTNGVKCTFNSDCASGDCSFNVCKSKTSNKQLGNGVACTFNSDCASGDCSFNVCKSKSSSDKQLGTGIKCTFNSDCASKDCSFGVCR